MSSDAEALLAEGEQALEAGDWAGAEQAFDGALELEESPQALDGLGEARLWLGETHEGVGLCEQAYAAYLRDGERDRAVDVALWLCRNHAANFGNDAAAAGWLARARRLVDEHGLGSRLAQVLLHEAFAQADPTEGETLARKAYELGQDADDVDLQLCALSQLGAALVEQGRVAEGVGYLDEAMAVSLGGEGGHRDTVVFTSCTTMISCTTCAEFERAMQWIRATDRYARRYGSPCLYVECRTLYGAILIAIGDWLQAEEELTTALEVSRHAMPALHHQALATLAGLRLDQGRLEEAERLVVGPRGPAGRGRRDRQDPAAARAGGHRRGDAAPPRLAELDEPQLECLDLLAILGQVELAQDRPGDALDIGRRLAELGTTPGCRIAQANGARLCGQALWANGDDAALAHLDTALSAFTHLGMPLEVARTRLLAADVRRCSAPEVAIDEAHTALHACDALGAGHDADHAAGLLRDLGARAPRSGPKGLELLTRREQEVLHLVGEVLSNPEIAERLYISRRTVEQHVAHVLAKLGVNNRTEAAAVAARRRADGTPT